MRGPRACGRPCAIVRFGARKDVASQRRVDLVPAPRRARTDTDSGGPTRRDRRGETSNGRSHRATTARPSRSPSPRRRSKNTSPRVLHRLGNVETLPVDTARVLQSPGSVAEVPGVLAVRVVDFDDAPTASEHRIRLSWAAVWSDSGALGSQRRCTRRSLASSCDWGGAKRRARSARRWWSTTAPFAVRRGAGLRVSRVLEARDGRTLFLIGLLFCFVWFMVFI